MPSFIYFNCIIYYQCVCLCVCECMWRSEDNPQESFSFDHEGPGFEFRIHVLSIGTFTYWAVPSASHPLFLGWLRVEDYFPKPSAAVLRFWNWLAKAALAPHSDPSLWLLAYHLFFTCNRECGVCILKPASKERSERLVQFTFMENGMAFWRVMASCNGVCLLKKKLLRYGVPAPFLPSPLPKVCGVFSNRVFPSASGWQPSAVAIVYTVLGVSCTPLTDNLRGGCAQSQLMYLQPKAEGTL